MYDESWSGVSGGLAPCAYALPMPKTVSAAIGAPTDTTRAPPPMSTARRERAVVFSNFVMAHPPSAHHFCGAFDRFHDADVRPAAALDPGQRILDLGLGGISLARQEIGGCHDPSIDAVTALRHLLLDVCGL